MADFDFDKYLAARFPGGTPDKLNDLVVAREYKLQELEKFRQAEISNAPAVLANRAQAANSWAGKVSDTPDGFLGTMVNQVATGVEAGAREAGQMMAAPLSTRNAADQNLVTSEAFDAWNREIKGKATPQDKALLDLKTNRTVTLSKPNTGLQGAVSEGLNADNLTTRERIARMDNTRQGLLDIKDRTDLKSIVNTTRRDNLTSALKDTFNANIDQIEAGGRKLLEGDISGALDAYAGEGKMAGGAVADIAGNKIGAIEAVVAQIPQIAMGLMRRGRGAMATSNMGYAAQNYEEGIANYQKANGGAYPDEGQRRELAIWAASLAAAEHVGDTNLLKPFQAKATAKMAEDATKRSFKQSVLETGKVGGKGFLSEGGTETYQTYAEGQATLKPVTGADIFAGGVIGGLAGGGISTAGHAGSIATGNTEQDIVMRATKAEQKAKYDAAVASGDPSIYMDPKTTDYSPAKAVGTLFDSSKADTVTPEVRDAHISKASEVINAAEDKIDSDTATLAAGKLTNEARVAKIAELKQAIAGTTDERQLSSLNHSLTAHEAVTEAYTPAEIKQKEKDLTKLDGEVKAASTVLQELNDLAASKTTEQDVQAVVAKANGESTDAASRPAVERVLTLAMASTDKVTPEMATTLANNTNNALTSEERTALLKFADARTKETAAKELGDVSAEVLYGSPAGSRNPNKGITQYRTEVVNALKAGNQQKADAALAGLSAFAAAHAIKAKTALAAYKAQGKGATILNDGGKGWTIAPKKMDYKDPTVKQMGGYVLNSTELIKAFQVEASALKAAEAEMKSLLVVRFKTSTEAKAAPTAQAKPEAVVSAKTRENPSVQSTPSPAPTTISTEKNAEVESRPKLDKQATAEVPGVEAGGLGLYQAVLGPVEETHTQQNLIATQTTQSTGGTDSGSVRPLVAVKDFLTYLRKGGSDLSAYLKGFTDKSGMAPEQRSAIANFIANAKAWAPVIKSNLRAKGKDFRWEDPIQFLLQETNGKDLDLEENVKTAISAAAYLAVLNDVGLGAFNTDKDINKILLRDDDAAVSPEERATFNLRMVRENVWRNSVGQQVIQALGIKANKNATSDLLPRLASAFGAHAQVLLTQQGWLNGKVLTAQEMAVLLGQEINPDFSNQTTNFIGVNWTVDRSTGKAVMPAEVQTMVDANKGSQQVLEKLFSMEDATSEPLMAPADFKQKNPARTKEGVPSLLTKALDEKQKEENYVHEGMWKIASLLPEELFLKIAGLADEVKGRVHKVNRIRNLAKNNALRREFAMVQNFVSGTLAQSDNGLQSPFYFQYSVWQQQRVGLASGSLNPQQSKMQRQLMYKPAWETEIDPANAEQMDNFKLRVLEGLGVKTGDRSNTASLKAYEAYFGDTELLNPTDVATRKLYKDAVAALIKGTIRNEPLTSQDEKAIVDASLKGGEDVHSLRVLMEMAQATHAEGKPFTTTLTAEVDGVTNGPMLSHILYGAAASVAEMFTRGNKGGFFSKGSGVTDHNKWKEDVRNTDLYQSTIKQVDTAINLMIAQKPGLGNAYAAIYRFTGDLVNGKGEVTKDGRNIIKTAINAIHFGSGLGTSVSNMSGEFIESIYARIEKLAQDDLGGRDSARSIVTDINSLLWDPKAGSKLLPMDMTIEQLMETELSKSQVAAIRKSFENKIGKAVKQTIASEFGSYIAQRDTFNKVAQTTSMLYGAYADAVRKSFIEELMDAHDRGEPGIAWHYVTDKVTKAKSRAPKHDLTASQEAELAKKLDGIKPLMHTAMSKADGNIKAGILLAKQTQSTGNSPAYQSEVKVGKGAKYTKAMERVMENIGVGASSKFLHSLDSAISHTAQLGHQVINMHDALMMGLKDVMGVSKALNKATWDQLLAYSPGHEMYQTFATFLGKMDDLIANGSLSKAELVTMGETVQKYVDQQAKRNPSKEGGLTSMENLLLDMHSAALSADRMKLSTMAEMGAVNQYAIEDGSYVVTDADRQAAADAQGKLIADVPVATLELARRVDSFLKEALDVVVSTDKADTAAKTVVSDALDAVMSMAPVHHLVQLIEHAATDKTLPDSLQASMAAVLAGLGEQGGDLRTALMKVFSPAEITGTVQLLASRLAAIPAKLWGELGTPVLAQDADLVAAFEKRGVLTARQLLQVLQGLPSMSAFDQKLVKILSKTVNPDLEIRYLTSATASELTLPNANGEYGNVDKSRGWYALQGSSEAIYVQGTEYRGAAVSKELMLHEMLHAALAFTIEGELQAPSTGPARELVSELTALLAVSKAYATENGMDAKYGAALTNVHELVSWGLTNQAFQRDVLTKVQFDSKTKKNALVTGMEKFIQAISAFLFKKPAEAETNGLFVLVSNVSGLLLQVGQDKANRQGAFTASMATVAAGNGLQSYTTEQLYDGLGNLGNAVNPAWDAHLRGLLNGMVQKIHGPYGSFKRALMVDQAITPSEILEKARVTGVAPFASMAVGHVALTEQEAFVLEQAEVTFRAAMQDPHGNTSSIYSALSKLYLEVRGKLKDSDFEQNGLRSPTEAKALRDFIFTMQPGNGDKSDHLSRFAAMGLAHEGFNSLLDVATARDVRGLADVDGFGPKLQYLFEKVLSLISGYLTHTVQGEMANQRLTKLVEQLVDIEGKKQDKLNNVNTPIDVMGGLDDRIRSAVDYTKTKLEAFANSQMIRGNSNNLVRMGGSLVSTVAGSRTMTFLDVASKWQANQTDGQLKIAAHLLKDLAGSMEHNFQALLRMAKHTEKLRKHVKTQTSKFALESFANAGKGMAKETKAAISAVFLRTGAHVLLDHYDMAGIERLLSNRTELASAIASFEAKLVGLPGVGHYYVNQADFAGYAKATGEDRNAMVMQNAAAIANLHGTAHTSTLTAAQAESATKDIDVLITLQALKYVSLTHKTNAANVLRDENNRTEGGNGVEGALRLHKHLEEDARQKNFSGSELLMSKGYVSENYNPYIDIKVAEGVDGNADLMDQGYAVGAVVQSDKAVPGQPVMRIHVLKDGGKQPLLTGTFSYTGMHAKGSTVHNGNTSLYNAAGRFNAISMHTIAAAKQADIARLFMANPSRDPSKVGTNYMAPVLNSAGDIVNWRHMMSESTKDSLLERDNSFDEILGSMASSTMDKATATEQNRKAIEALRENYLDGFATDPNDYLEVGPSSSDPELRAIYAMLPTDTKKVIREVWGKDTMRVRKHLVDINFGYHKLSLGSILEKKDRNRQILNGAVQGNVEELGPVEAAFAFTVEFMLGMETAGKNAIRRRNGQPLLDPQRELRRAAHVVRKSERLWQEIVHEAKDIIVVKSGSVMFGNIASNMVLLIMNGVPMLDIIKYHKVAIQAATEHQQDSGNLAQLEAQVATGRVTGNLAEVQQEIIRLKDAIARNPVTPLVDAGLSPTIVEDVGLNDDIFSYKSRLARKFEKWTENVPQGLVAAGKVAYMAHDTKVYRSLSHITQLSDFVARYAMYQHLTTRQKNPLSHDQAIQEASDAFINYDIPMHRKLQYGDDMGAAMFIKYFIRIQHVIAKLVREHPGQALEALLVRGYIDMLPTVLDASAVARIGNNPLSLGALELPRALDELMTVKTGLSLFK